MIRWVTRGRKLDWEAQYACALDPETARAIRDSRSPEEDHSDTCSMCGKFCAVRSMNKEFWQENLLIYTENIQNYKKLQQGVWLWTSCCSFLYNKKLYFLL